jgi:hypothetical protein
VVLSNPGPNSIDVKVVKGKTQLEYKVGPGYTMNRALATGYITFF